MAEMNNSPIAGDVQLSAAEANLQAYRQLSIATQSLFLAVGAILLGFGDRIPFFIVFGIAMVAAWYLFFPIVFARAAVVDFHKFNLGERFTRTGDRLDPTNPVQPLLDHEYANVFGGRSLRRRIYAQMATLPGRRFRTVRTTRWKLDIVLPGLVTLMWLMFAVYTIATN